MLCTYVMRLHRVNTFGACLSTICSYNIVSPTLRDRPPSRWFTLREYRIIVQLFFLSSVVKTTMTQHTGGTYRGSSLAVITPIDTSKLVIFAIFFFLYLQTQRTLPPVYCNSHMLVLSIWYVILSYITDFTYI